MKITLVIGTRPNFMKAYPLYEAIKQYHDIYIIHTGQHFDDKMSKSILKQLGFPEPNKQFTLESKTKAGTLDHQLYVDNQSYLSNKAKVLEDLCTISAPRLGQLGEIRDKILNELKLIKPDLIMVFGDVTSTLAGALAGYIMNIKIAHIESGLRSFDLSMPEEVNRILTDHITSYYFVTEQSGVDNLLKESVDSKHIYLVGNTMIDSLFLFKKEIEKISYHESLGLLKDSYVLVTLHRPGNVDDIQKLRHIIEDLNRMARNLNKKIIFPIHPRTKAHILKSGLLEGDHNSDSSILYLEPLPYLQFISLILNAKCVITDSGGIQEETTALGIPCFTLRPNTERPSTLIENGGTNKLIDDLSLVELNSENLKAQINDYQLMSPTINKILCKIENKR